MKRVLPSANLVEVSNGKLFVNDYEPPSAKGRFLVVERGYFEFQMMGIGQSWSIMNTIKMLTFTGSNHLTSFWMAIS